MSQNILFVPQWHCVTSCHLGVCLSSGTLGASHFTPGTASLGQCVCVFWWGGGENLVHDKW